MQFIFLFALWAISLIGIVTILSYTLWRIRRGEVSTHGRADKKEEAAKFLSNVVLLAEKQCLIYGERVLDSLKHYTLSDLKEIFARQVPVRFIKKKLEAFFRTNGNYENRGEASPFLKSISEHKDEVRRNGNGEHTS